MKKSPLTKLIITTVTLCAFIGALGFSLFKTSQHIKDSRSALGRIETKTITTEQERNRIASTDDVLKEQQDNISRLERKAINRQRPLEFIERIEQIGHRTNNLIALNVEESRSNPESLFFRLSIDGTEQNVRNMLSLVEALPFPLNIEGLTFQRGGILERSATFASTHMVIEMKVRAQ